MASESLAPADGLVWKIVKKAGDTVSEGDEIVILESMKMEIPVTAATGGTITRLFVEEGQAVEEDDTIAEVE
ncbi:acetyl-CoA carboxylase biotin carboxyl carrier protein subunit [Prauserella marina]|uniref:Biotin-requiring enzyme n=1 Tax=Prauserella marina TaxID=530584 RepID=A0A222VPH9_9PSEU|nr:biotin/lipoyl-binding carrier protein [Prauserella marina]ASR35810.1 acetyl-CoA carboxylase biotin carboxyl carrier protein subunit [Prauserella marina]PWV84286.1 biotin-dependent enzyme [Prauserella marina]SDC26202.1 Biotin-requiring enzyme [Prauserella marina]